MQDQDFILLEPLDGNRFYNWYSDYVISGKQVEVFISFEEKENGMHWDVAIYSDEPADKGNDCIVEKSGIADFTVDALIHILLTLKEVGFPHLPLFIMYPEKCIVSMEAPALILKSLYYRFYEDENGMEWGECNFKKRFLIQCENYEQKKIVVIDPKEIAFFEYEYKIADLRATALSFIKNDYKETVYK